MKILKKNHFIHEVPESLNDLYVLLAKEKSVYFAPLDRVMPTAFFKGWSWGHYKIGEKHLRNGSFRRAERKDTISRRRIRSILKEIPIPA